MPGPATAPGLSKSPGGRTIRPFGPLIRDRAEPELGLGDQARHLLRHPPPGVVHLQDADARVDAVANQQQRHQARQVLGAAHDGRRPEERRHHRHVQHQLRDARKRRARERMEHHRGDVDDRHEQPRLRRVDLAVLGVAKSPPRQQRHRNRERRHTDVEADALRPGQKEERRNRGLADDEELRNPPLRRRRRQANG